MNWNLEGLRIEGSYLDAYPFRGRVTNSRVKFGGRVIHTVELAEMIIVHNIPRDTLTVEIDEISTVFLK